jgi:predicted Zn-dependent peptidase
MDLRTRSLPNGLTVASVRLPGFRTAAVGAFIRVGSRDEPATLNGISHFLEHMAFKGTELRDARRISLEIERVGASMNAYTAKDHTAYHTVLLSEHMPVALDVLADVIRRSTFPPEEIERERQVILQELGDAADDPESIAQDEFDLKAFPKQAFGRPILGSARFVRSVTRDDFRHYLDSHYAAGNMVIAGVGALDHEQFADQVERHFGDMTGGSAAPREAARYVGGYRHVDDDYEQTSIALGWPIPARTDPTYPTYELLGELLGGGMSSPLFQSVREQRGLAYQIDAWGEGHDDCGTLQITAGVAPRNLRVFFDVVCTELTALTRRIAPEDLERTRPAGARPGAVPGRAHRDHDGHHRHSAVRRRERPAVAHADPGAGGAGRPRRPSRGDSQAAGRGLKAPPSDTVGRAGASRSPGRRDEARGSRAAPAAP